MRIVQVNLGDKFGRPPLSEAAIYDNLAIAEMLLARHDIEVTQTCQYVRGFFFCVWMPWSQYGTWDDTSKALSVVCLCVCSQNSRLNTSDPFYWLV